MGSFLFLLSLPSFLWLRQLFVHWVEGPVHNAGEAGDFVSHASYPSQCEKTIAKKNLSSVLHIPLQIAAQVLQEDPLQILYRGALFRESFLS